MLIVGGEGASTIKVAELFDPVTSTFTALTGAEHEMNEARGYPLAARLPDGKILIAGGSNGFVNNATAEIFDPATDSFTLLKGTGRYMTTPRRNAVSSVLPSGAVLIAGGTNGVELMSAEVFDPTTETFTALNGSGQALSQPRTSSFAAPLPDGRVLIAGGSSGFSSTASAEVLNVSPARALVEGGDFGSQVVGRPAGTQTLIVDAVGAEPLSILDATIAGTDREDFAIVATAAKASCSPSGRSAPSQRSGVGDRRTRPNLAAHPRVCQSLFVAAAANQGVATSSRLKSLYAILR